MGNCLEKLLDEYLKSFLPPDLLPFERFPFSISIPTNQKSKTLQQCDEEIVLSQKTSTNMKKKSVIFLTMALLASTIFLFAALSPHRSKLKTDEEKFESISGTEARRGEYTVRLIQASENTYGFDVRKGNTVVFLQLNNPFYPTPEGFISPNDAFNVGWWVVEEFKTTGTPPLAAAFNEILEKELNVQRRRNF